MDSLKIVMKVLNESFGIFLFGNDQEDFSLSEYIVDSVSLIQFIIAIEEEIGNALPDDFLDYEILESAKGFAVKLDAYLQSIK